MQVRCKRWLSESKNPAKLREGENRCKPPCAVLTVLQCKPRLSFTPTADFRRLHGRSRSHMSVAQGTEVLYMRLGGYRRYRLVVGLQKLFIHSQLDSARWVPVGSVVSA